jgi:hypothetical protein
MGKFFSGIICLVLQLTLIGWLPAAIWAFFASAPTKLYEPLDPGSMTTETDHVIEKETASFKDMF